MDSVGVQYLVCGECRYFVGIETKQGVNRRSLLLHHHDQRAKSTISNDIHARFLSFIVRCLVTTHSSSNT